MTVTQFEVLLERYGNSVFGFCCHLTGDSMRAEDLYQDAILKAFSLLGRMQCEENGGYESARNYILGIAVRLHRNARRKHSSHEQPLTQEDVQAIRSGCDAAAEVEQREMQKLVREAVEDLPEKLRTVTYLYYYAELRIEEIAQVLHIPKGTVKSRLSRARASVKKELEEKGYERI